MRRAVLLAALALTGCTATLDRAVGRNVSVSPLLADDCRAQCDKLKMRLAAVVVTSTVGACVCEPVPAPGAPGSPSASAGGIGGALAIAAAAQAEEEKLNEASRESAPTIR